ncbi:N-acetyltransferase [Paraliobacillus quinghaiensis]|uniref:N-acetyltransferase n=1 Tax=Paraliobacillus quinghaiensis TaxID=470815 RepID=A0A917TCI0_9BACI|nr:GNAT family N-acetyltransferase [Paraliobacillus quinghaiensis]GGM18491.1 N-acetyltransferase [Paraliobacillus quinghaiensis]
MNVIIREMVKEDIKEVQDVAKASWNATYEGIISREIQERFLNAAYNNEMMEKRLEATILLVAEIENDIVGFANFSSIVREGKAELSAIYLKSEHQSKGIGTALLQEGVKKLENVREIYVDVEKENEAGKTFYDAKGFKTVEEFDDNFDGQILKTVRMVLKV